jgi:type II secretory pathway component PulF
MPLFRFKIAEKSGKTSETIVEADNHNEAIKRLRLRKVVVLDFLGDANDDLSNQSRHIFTKHKFDPVDFTERLVPLLDANIPLDKSLHILGEASSNPLEIQLTSDLRRGLHEGKSLSKLIGDRGNLFPKIYANIIEAGEESGALAQVMNELRNFMADSKEMKNFVVTSSIYPVFVLVISTVVVLFMLGYIVPLFAKSFQSSGQELSSMLQILLGLGNFIKNFWWLFFVFLGGFFALVRAIKQGGPIRKKWDKFVLKLPLIGNIVLFTNLGRMLRTMAVLMKSGVHLLETVRISTKVIENSAIQDSISFISTDLRKGEKLSKSLSKSDYIPTFISRMLSVGEEIGKTAEMLESIAERLDSTVKKTLKKIIVLLEPLMIIFLAIVVGSILVILFMTILESQSGF